MRRKDKLRICLPLITVSTQVNTTTANMVDSDNREDGSYCAKAEAHADLVLMRGNVCRSKDPMALRVHEVVAEHFCAVDGKHDMCIT